VKRTSATILFLSLALAVSPSISNAAVKAGDKCKKEGQISTSPGKKYTCVMKGKKLLWNKGVLIPVAKPAATASASATPSESAKPVVVADPELSSKSIYADASMCQLKSSITTEADLGYQMDPTFLNSTGNVNLAIIYTTYTDAAGDDRAFSEYEKVQFPEVAKFYSNSSYGRLKITLTTNNKYYNINKPSASYNLEAMNQSSKFSDVAVDAVNAAKGDYDFSKIDAILVVMPSSAKTVDLGAMGIRINEGGKTFHQGITASYINPSNKKAVSPRFLVHEIGHNFGLVHPLSQQIGYGWDVMAWEDVPGADLFGWEKYILKWIDPTQVNCSANIPNEPITSFVEATGISSSNTKMNMVRLSESKALVIESRRKSAIDELAPNEEGVLVYTIDVNLGSNRAPIKLFSNDNPVHTMPNGNRLILGSLQEGESISAEGMKVTVLKHGQTGDFVSISKDKA
jgi:M6 family metalloprotease-like protein